VCATVVSMLVNFVIVSACHRIVSVKTCIIRVFVCVYAILSANACAVRGCVCVCAYFECECIYCCRSECVCAIVRVKVCTVLFLFVCACALL
jgi:hypothetical protein